MQLLDICMNPFPVLGSLFLIIWSCAWGRDSGERFSQILLALMSLISHSLGISLSVGFWIFHRGNLSVNCCWIGVFVSEMRVQAFLPCHLAGLTTIIFSSFQFHTCWANSETLHKFREHHYNKMQCKWCPPWLYNSVPLLLVYFVDWMKVCIRVGGKGQERRS